MKLQEDKKDELAYVRFKAVVASFPGSPAAATAAEQVKAYDEKNPSLSQKANESRAVGGKARAALSVAASYERLGKYDQAQRSVERDRYLSKNLLRKQQRSNRWRSYRRE